MGSSRHSTILLGSRGHIAVASVIPGVVGSDRYTNRRSPSSTAAKPAPAATPRTSQSHTSRRRTLPGASRARITRGASLHTSSTAPATTIAAAGAVVVTLAAATTRRDSHPTTPAHGIATAKTPETSRHETVLVRAIQNQANTTHTVPSHAARLTRSASLTTSAISTTGKAAQTAIA